MSNDQTTRDAVLDVLKDHRIKKLNFGISVYQFGSHHYHQLANAIRKGKVSVAYDATLVDTAAHNPRNDTIYLGFTRATHLEHKAAIVHECTHAICDMLSLRLMDQTTSEAAAYIAQYMFIGAGMHPVDRSRISFKQGTDAHNIGGISSAAWRIAHANLVYYETGNSAKGWGVSKDYQDIEDAVKKSSLYAHKHKEFVGYDGV